MSDISDVSGTGGMGACERFEGQKYFIGTITPSGNTVVERITLGVARELPAVSVHFSRTPVFGTSDPSPDAYVTKPFLAAARLLAHAAPKVLVWNGSKGAGIGFAHDRALARAIQVETGIATTTLMLGMASLFERLGVRRLGVVTPYSDAGHKKTLDCLAGEGFECVGSASAGLSDNLSYASVSGQQIAEMTRQAAQSRPDAIVCLCTNFPAAILAAPMEKELGIAVYDSTALGVWHALQLAGCDTSQAAPMWGSLFRQTA